MGLPAERVHLVENAVDTGKFSPGPDDAAFRARPNADNTGLDIPRVATGPAREATGALIAWDPVARKEVWRVQHPGHWNGGTLSTAGGLVFPGCADGPFPVFVK